MSDQTHRHLNTRFGEFEIDRQACALYRNGHRIPLQIQPFRVLEALVDSAGEVVTRATLCARIWPGTVYIDVDRGLNNAMNRLRQALGDSGDTPRFIETLPRIGYRFIHPVESPVAVKSPVAALPVRPAADSGRRRAWRIGMVALSALVIGTVAIAVARWAGNQTDAASGSASTDRPTQIAEAQVAYMRGIKLLERRNKESLEQAILHLQRATELDPTFAEAFAELAVAYAGAGGTTSSRFMSADQALEPALAAAERALQLNPELGRAHVALARVLNSLQPWSKPTDLAIEQSYRRGLELEPADADVHLQFGNFLAKRGRSEEALAHFRVALELDPLSPSVNSRLGQELMAAGRTDEGLELIRRTVELDPFQFNARFRLGWAYVTVGDLEAAEREFSAADRISPNSPPALSGLAFTAARRGDAVRARALLDRVLPIARSNDDSFHVAIVYVGLKEREASLEWLAKTVQGTRILHGKPPWGLHAQIYDWLRDDARFRQLEQEIVMTPFGGQLGESVP
ncbi:MAG TPA: tetratricopeptide repeat protein [Steroidobacteraceae bacterium]|nr:tetratricopeptide repeat protein [Steroidobacteraceae bacterium]